MTAEEMAITLNLLGNVPIWVAWQIEARNDDGKPTKVPHSPHGRLAQSNNPKTWGTRAAAESRAARLPKPFGVGGIGIELTELKGTAKALGGVDLDTCRDPTSGAIEPWAQAVINRFATYTEVSPGKQGFKVFFTFAVTDLPELRAAMGTKHGREWKRGNGQDHPPGIEFYTSNRFFTVTEDRLDDSPEALRLVALEDLLWLVREAGPAFAGNGKGQSGNGKGQSGNRKGQSGNGKAHNGGDGSRSAAAFNKGVALRRTGATFEEMVAALRADPETADWVREKGEANNQRELKRIWAKGASEQVKPRADEDEPENFDAAPAGDAERARATLQIGSDVEIARRVAEDLHADLGEVIVCDGRFWHYRNTHWEAVPDHELRTAVHRYDGALYVTPMHSTEAVKLSKPRVTSVLCEMAAMRARPNFFADAAVGINCRSGFIAFAADGSPQLQPHRPEHLCRHVLPGTWRADLNGAEPPADSLLATLLNGVFQDDPDAISKRKLLAEIAGSAALGYGTKLQQPKAVIFKGETAENGKSQILDLIRGLLPASAIASVTAAKIGDERFIVGLAGKLLNAADELSASSAVASDTFKAVITGEPVSGRDVYQSAVTFRPTAQHVFATNALPTFSGGMDRGVQRRLLVVTFNRVIPVKERIERIGIRVGEEEPDLLLAWAVAGAARLIQERGFTVPPSSATALQSWLYDADPVLAWVHARVDAAKPILPGQKVVGIKSSYAHSLFRQWALNEGFRDSMIPAVNGFVQRLQANKAIPGIAVRHTRSGNWLTGLTILGTDRDPDKDNIKEADPVHPSGIDFNGYASRL
jgi:putative DNA primase/helicase